MYQYIGSSQRLKIALADCIETVLSRQAVPPKGVNLIARDVKSRRKRFFLKLVV
jgi:hypothetical protein